MDTRRGRPRRPALTERAGRTAASLLAAAAVPAAAVAVILAAAWGSALLAAGPAAAQAPVRADQAAAWPASAPAVRLDPVFPKLPPTAEVLRLENGLQVLLLRNPAQPMVGIYTQVRVGSAYEDFRTSGMSHMLEHLLFNGTAQYTQQQLYDEADLHGAYNNASTSAFYTDFMLVLPAVHLETGLKIQSQMLFHSTLPADKFAKEQEIVLGELVQARDRDVDFAEEALREALFAGSSLALPVLGTRSTIAGLKRDDVWAFYRNHYVPNNMVTTIAGNFDRDEAVALLRKYYEPPAPGTVRTSGLLPAVFVDRTQTIVRRGGDRPALLLAFDAPSYGSPDFFPFLALSQLLTAPGDGILTRALAEVPLAERPELSSWWEKADGFGRFVLRFDLKNARNPERWYRLVQDACNAALEWGLTDDEVLATVHTEETRTLLDREQLRQFSVASAEMIVLGGVDFFLGYLDRLRDVNATGVVQCLGGYLADAACLALLVLPEEDAGGGASGAAEAGRGKAAPAAPVVKRSVLPCGTVLVTQQTPDASLFAAHLTARNRASLDGERPGAVNLVHRLLTSGVGGCDAGCLQKKLRRLGAVLKLVDDPRIPMDNYYSSGRFSFIRLETAADRGPDALALLVDLARNASFSAADFERERASQIAQLSRQLGSAGATANRKLEAALFGDHPLARPVEGDPASLKALTYEEARRVYHEAFAPENLILAVVSPYSHEELAATLGGLLPGRGRPRGGLPPAPVTTAADRVAVSLGGEMGAIRVGALLRVAPEDRRPLELLVAILSNRLAMDLREQKGLSYSVGASFEMLGGEGEFQAWLNPPRERLAEGERTLREFLAAFDPATITQAELDRTRNATAGRLMMRRLASISQAYYLAMAELDGDLGQYERMLAAYDGVRLSDLRRVWGRHLRELPLVTVVVD